MLMSVFIILLVVVVVVFAIKDIRLNLITRPTFKMFKKVLPPLSQTEREAMEAGDVWWDGELFKNIGLKVGYGNNADDSDNDAYFANLRFQF